MSKQSWLLAVSAILLAAGQALMLVAGQTVPGAALTGAALLGAFFAFVRPSIRSLSWALAALGLVAAVVAQTLVKQSPQLGLFLFIAAGLLLFAARPGEGGWLSQGSLPAATAPRRKWEIAFFILLALIAIATRFYKLNDLPPGAIGQEGELAGYYLTFMEKAGYMPYTLDYGNLPWPTLTVYQGAFFGHLLGWTAGHLRIAGAIWSVLSILVFYLVARRLTSPGTAAITSLLLTANLLHLVLSRRYFPYAILFVPVVLGFGLLITGMKRPKLATFILAGAAAGLSLHGYDPGRGVFIIFLSWLAGMWLFHRDELPAPRFLLWFWISFVIIATPTLYHAVVHWDGYWYYVQFHANANRGKGLMSYVHQVLGTLPPYAQMFHVSSDLDYAQHLPKEPLLDPVAGALFGAGLFLCLAMAWEPVPMFLLLFLAAGLMPALLGTNYAHPTTRRVVMAIPAVYLIGALALERLRRVFVSPSRPWVGWILGAVGLAAAGWSLVNGIEGYFVRYAGNPGTKADFYYKGYLCGREMRAHPDAKVTIQAMLPYIHDPMLLPRDRDFRIPHSVEEMLMLDPGRENLVLMESYMEAAEPFLRECFPNAQIQTTREANLDDPVCGTYFYMKLGTDPNNPGGYLTRALIPAADVRAFQALVDVTDPAHPARVPAFQPEFAGGRAGRSLALTGTFFALDGGSFRFACAWPGWSLRIDGRPAAWNAGQKLDGGVHVLDLAGRVPAEARGALPLQVFDGARDLVPDGRVVALARRPGLKVTMWRPRDHWEGPPDAARRELLPFKRFYDPTTFGVPFSSLCEARVRVPRAGRYQFSLRNTIEGRLVVDGQTVFDNLKSREAENLKPLTLAAGQVVTVRGYYRTEGETQARTFMLYVQAPGAAKPSWVPLDWFVDEP